MGDPLSGQNVRKPRSVYIQDVFSAGRWLASAPLHEAGKTTRSGNTLKPGVRREELGSASDNLSSDPNAYPLISTFSKPHSEVASTTHLPALKRFRKGAPLFSGLAQDGRSPQQIYNQIGRLTLSRKSARSPGREKAPFRRWSSLLTRLSKSCI